MKAFPVIPSPSIEGCLRAEKEYNDSRAASDPTSKLPGFKPSTHVCSAVEDAAGSLAVLGFEDPSLEHLTLGDVMLLRRRLETAVKRIKSLEVVMARCDESSLPIEVESTLR